MFTIFLVALFAQIKGIVLDNETHDPVIGAAVYTTANTGTYSDINGNFSLPNVKIGDSLIITHITYLPETLLVKSSFITVYMKRKYYRLSPITVRVSPLKRRLKTSSTVYIKTGEDIEIGGWKEPWKAIETFPGVIQGFIRGGRRDETLYSLDGAPIIDNVQREIVFRIPPWAVSSIELVTSGFEPEFGDLTAGLLKMSSKKMNLNRETHFYLNSELTNSDIGEPQYEYLAGGFFSTRHAFLSVRGKVGGGRHTWPMWSGVYSFPITKSIDYLANNTIPLGKGFILLQALGYLSKWREYENLWRYYPQGLPERARESHRVGIIYSGKLTERFGLDFTLFDYIMNYQVFGKNTREYDMKYKFDSLGYVLRGDKPVWTDRFQNRIFFKSKINFYTNALHGYIGVEANQYDLYVREIQIYPEWISSYRFLAFMTYINKYHYRPNSQAGFVSLKFKSGEDLVHFGLRFDRFNPRSYRPAVEIPHEWPPPEWVYEPQDSVPAKVKYQISPRLGISHRAKKLVIRFNYGEYFQVPQFKYLYSNPFYNFHRGYLPLVGNPDLKASRTRLYEYSVLYLPDPTQNISVNIFYRESDHLVDAIRIMPDTASFADLGTGITIYEDVGEATSVGLEFQWEGYKPGLHWNLSYTLMKANGTYGTWLENSIEQVEGVNIEPFVRYPLSWDQRHTISFECTLGDINFRFLTIFLKWGSGLPYSPRGGPPNSKRLPPNFESSLRAGIRLSRWLLSLRIYNLFNRKNVLWVDGDGRPGGKLKDPLAFSEGRRIWLESTLYF